MKTEEFFRSIESPRCLIVVTFGKYSFFTNRHTNQPGGRREGEEVLDLLVDNLLNPRYFH